MHLSTRYLSSRRHTFNYAPFILIRCTLVRPGRNRRLHGQLRRLDALIAGSASHNLAARMRSADEKYSPAAAWSSRGISPVIFASAMRARIGHGRGVAQHAARGAPRRSVYRKDRNRIAAPAAWPAGSNPEINAAGRRVGTPRMFVPHNAGQPLIDTW